MKFREFLNEKLKYGNDKESKDIIKFYKDIIKKLKVFTTKNSKMKISTTKYGVHLSINYINWNEPYKYFISYDNIKNDEFKEMTEPIIFNELRSIL